MLRLALVWAFAAVTVCVALPSIASAAETAYTSPGGVTYFGASGAASFDFSAPPPEGTMSAGTEVAGNHYTATITCATFLGGVAYFGAHITSASPSATAEGMYEFWRVTAGGPGVGTVAGLEYPTETCYDGSNADPGWNVFTITSGTITIAEKSAPVNEAPLPGTQGVVVAPTNKICLSRRDFTIHIRQLAGLVPYRQVVVYLDGKRIKVTRGKQVTAPIDLRGLPKGRYTVRISVITNTGRALTGTRTYHTCAPHPLHPTRQPTL